MKIFHEAPICLFNEVQKYTDGDYCLVHLYVTNKEYRNKFLEAKKKGREIILDNSVFELGEAFDKDIYIDVIKELKPDYYVIPDVLGESDKTIENVKNFPKFTFSKSIGVVQGNTIMLSKHCYESIVDDVDVVAFTMAYPFMNKDPLVRMHERINFISKLYRWGTINEEKVHHLLGVNLPQEVMYMKDFSFIKSVDTSNPVVTGILGIRYQYYGLVSKPTLKVADIIEKKCTLEQYQNVLYNIEEFRRYSKL